MAAAAYDAAVLQLKGPNARFNFPSLVQSLPKPASSSADDIRQASQEAAMRFRNGQLSEAATVGSTGGTLPARVELSPSHIQAINDTPLDSPKMWMELAGQSLAGDYEGVDTDAWDDTESYSIWD